MDDPEPHSTRPQGDMGLKRRRRKKKYIEGQRVRGEVGNFNRGVESELNQNPFSSYLHSSSSPLLLSVLLFSPLLSGLHYQSERRGKERLVGWVKKE